MISIIIPAHNEERRIGKTLEEYAKFFRRLKQQKKIDNFEIVVVLNACRDKTLAAVKKARKKYREITYLNFEIAGKGFAIIEGFRYSTKKKRELIGFVDADMATPPEAFYDLIGNMQGYDGIVASRYIRGAIVDPKPTFQRVVSSRVFNFLIRALFLMNYRDTQCGAKLFTGSAIERILPELVITQWAFDVNLLHQAKRKRLKIREFPTIWSDKEYSKINLKRAGPSMFLSVVRLRLLNSPFKFIVRAYNLFPDKMKLHS